MREIIPLIICAVLAGCESSTPILAPSPCAAEKPKIDITHIDGYFVISDGDMGQITGYISALEAGCIAPK